MHSACVLVPNLGETRQAGDDPHHAHAGLVDGPGSGVGWLHPLRQGGGVFTHRHRSCMVLKEGGRVHRRCTQDLGGERG